MISYIFNRIITSFCMILQKILSRRTPQYYPIITRAFTSPILWLNYFYPRENPRLSADDLLVLDVFRCIRDDDRLISNRRWRLYFFVKLPS